MTQKENNGFVNNCWGAFWLTSNPKIASATRKSLEKDEEIWDCNLLKLESSTPMFGLQSRKLQNTLPQVFKYRVTSSS